MQFVFLTVQPQIIQLKNETTFENGKATLICEAEGEPVPEITWKRAVDGMTFSEGDKVNQLLVYKISKCVFVPNHLLLLVSRKLI